MRRSPILVAVAVLALTLGGQQALATESTGRSGTAPVSRLHAFADDPGISLTWTNPTAKGFRYVAVRYVKGSRPPGRHSGREVHVARHATSTKLTGLARDTTYTANVWAYYASGRSSAEPVRFTTGGGTTSGRGRFAARFVDRAGDPLAGVVVYAADVDSDSSSGPRAVSGRDGRVNFSLPVGQYFVNADGSDATGGSSDATGYVGWGAVDTIRAAVTRRTGTVRLAPGAEVRVHVEDDAGRPVAGVTPTVTPAAPYVSSSGDLFNEFEAYDYLGIGRTDRDGNTVMRGVYPNEAFRVCVDPVTNSDATRGVYLANCTANTELAHAGRITTADTLTLRRAAGGVISGTLRGHGHSGFDNSAIVVRRGKHVVTSTETMAHGAFRVAGLAPGTYRVCSTDGPFTQLGRTGYLPGCAAHAVVVPASLSPRRANIVLRRAAAATGTLTGPGGVPVIGANVQSNRDFFLDSAVTDQYGHWLLKGLLPGRQSLCVFTDNMTPGRRLPTGVVGTCSGRVLRITAVPGRVLTGLDQRLRLGGAVSGTVVDTAGRPVPYAIVEMDPTSFTGPSSEDFKEVTTNRDGRYVVSGLHSARYQVCAGVGGDPDFGAVVVGCHKRPITVVAGHTVRHTRVVVPRTAAIYVDVADGHGRPVAGVDAAAIDACHGDCTAGTPLLTRRATTVVQSETTDSNGQVFLGPLPVGKYAVCVFAYYGTTRDGAPSTGYGDTCTGTELTIDVTAGKTVTVHLVLHPAGAVTGRVTDSAGNPLGNVLVRIAGSAADDLPAYDIEYGDQLAGVDGGASATPAFYARTSADGTFTVRSIRPGQPLVCFAPSHATGGASTTGYRAQCLGGTPGSTTTGTPVTVTSGIQTNGADIALTAKS